LDVLIFFMIKINEFRSMVWSLWISIFEKTFGGTELEDGVK